MKILLSKASSLHWEPASHNQHHIRHSWTAAPGGMRPNWRNTRKSAASRKSGLWGCPTINERRGGYTLVCPYITYMCLILCPLIMRHIIISMVNAHDSWSIHPGPWPGVQCVYIHGSPRLRGQAEGRASNESCAQDHAEGCGGQYDRNGRSRGLRKPSWT